MSAESFPLPTIERHQPTQEMELIQKITNSPDPVEVTMSPDTWDSLRNAVVTYGDRHASTELQPDGSEKRFATITPRSFQKIIGDSDKKFGIKNPDGSPIANPDGTPITDSQMLASFEAMQQDGMIAKVTNGKDSDAFRLNLGPKSSKLERGPGYGLASHDSDPRTVSGKWARIKMERGAEYRTAKTNYGSTAKKVGNLILGLGNKLITPEETPQQIQAKATEAKRQEDALDKIDKHWTSQRETKLKLDLTPAELKSLDEPIYTSLPPMQRMRSEYGDGHSKQSGDTRPRSKQPNNSQNRTETDARPTEDIEIPARFESWFENRNLVAVDAQIAAAISHEATVMRRANGGEDLPDEDFQELARGIRNRFIDDYASRARMPDDVKKQLQQAFQDLR